MLLSDSLLPTIHTVYSGASSPSVVGGSTIGLAPSTTCVPPPLNASTSTPRSSSLSQLSSAGISSETQRGGVQEQENREAAPNIPTQLCTYYAKGINGVGQGCLRVNCKFFHGTEEMLEELWKGAGEAAPLSGDGENEADERVRPAILNMNLGDKKPIVCLAYLSNSCRRPGCRFLHLPSNVRPLPIAVCECFTRGSCTRKRCRFFHGPKELLSKMHAQGVTMYNPSTNEPHDPSSSLDELMRLQERTTVPLGPVLASDVNAQKESRVPSGQRGRKSKAPLKARSTATAPAGPSIADQGTFLFPTPTIPPAYTTQVPSAVHQHMPFPVPSASGIGSNAAYLPPNPHASVAPNTTITVIHHHHHHLDAGNEASGLSKTNLESASHIVSTEYTTIVTNGAEVPESVLLALMQQHPNTKFVSTTPLNPPIPSAPAARAAQIPHRGVDQLTNDPVVHASNASVTKEAQWRTLLLQPTADCPQWGAVE